MDRRQFLTGMGSGIVLIPAAGAALPVPHIGFLVMAQNPGVEDAFPRGLRDLGYIEGRDVVIERRSADGRTDRMRALAAEMVRLGVDLIVSGGPEARKAAMEATSTILSFAKIPPAGQVVDLPVRIRPLSQLDDHSPAPPASAAPLPLRRPSPAGPGEPCLAPAAPVYKRMMTRPRLRITDRLFWVGLARVWAGWRQSLVFVTPETVLRWQRRRFREHWAKLSGQPTVGRPPVNAELRALVGKMAAANPLWGAPRIHGELQKLGIELAERTVSRLLPKRRTPPSQTWRTFLTNHVQDLVSIDFFTVPTAGLRVLFVFVVLAHHRRRVLHFNITKHPTAAWTAQQIVDTFPDDSAPAYLLRDRDRIYGHTFQQRVKGMAICEVLTAPSSPWQNPFAERLIGSIRRDCLDHVIVLSERHLRRILTRYFGYYHHTRTHLSLTKDAPDGRPVEPPPLGNIVPIREVGGLHHRYVRRAA